MNKQFLTREQAVSVYRAMVEANNVGTIEFKVSFPHKAGVITVEWLDLEVARFFGADSADLTQVVVKLESVRDYQAQYLARREGSTVHLQDEVVFENHDTQAAFAVAYSMELELA